MPTLDEIFASTVTPKPAASKPSLDDIFKSTQGQEGDVVATSPQGQSTLEQLRGYDPEVDYTKGAPFGARYNLFRASNKGEEEKYLRAQYGEGNFRQDRGGNWLVRQQPPLVGGGGGDVSTEPWTPVYPKGVMEGLKTMGAAAGGVAPTVGTSLAGGVAGGLVGGPPGAFAGVVGGAMGGKGLDEAAKAAQGFYDKTAGELATEIGTEGALAGVFQGAGPLKRAIQRPLYSGTSALLGKYGGVTPESKAIAQSLERFGVNPPISSVAPGLKTFEYDRRLRNMIMSDPNAPARIGAIDQRMGEVLQGFGIQGPAQAQAMLQIQDKTTALSGRDVGEGIAQRLKARETGLMTEEAMHRTEAERLAREAYDAVRNLSRQPTGRLGEDVAGAFQLARETFTDNMNQAYGAIDRMTGNRPIVNTDAVSREAAALLDVMDPQAVPPIIARLARGGVPMTFQEAHNLRTTLREMGRVQDLSPIGQRRGNIMHMAGLVDDAIMSTRDQVGQQAAQALRATDTAYGQGVVRFTNKAVNDIIQDVRAGRMPNPETVANLLVDKTSTDTTRQMWGMLPPDIQARVQTADLKNMMDAASVTGKDGRQTLNPEALLRLLNSREDVNTFVHNPQFIQHMRELATDFQALGGQVDITRIPPTQIRQHLEQALGAKRALETEARTNPRIALRSDNPELVDAGARYFLSPGNEARTLAGAQMLGINSPEWQSVQRFAVQDMLKSAIKPKGLGRTIAGDEIDNYLGKYTTAQQQALFGNRLGDLKLIAKQARALFPEMEDEFGGSLAAASIKGGLPKRSAIRAYAWSWFAGKLADSPTLTKMLVGQLQQNPAKARGTISWLLQSGADMAVNSKPSLGGQGGEIPFRGGQDPNATLPLGGSSPTPKPDLPQGYGGPQ